MIKPSGSGMYGIVGWGSYGQLSKVNAFSTGTSSRLVNYWWSNDIVAHLGASLADGEFHHVAATYDGTTRKIFVDYALIVSQASSGYSATDKSNFCIGKTKVNDYFKGDMKNIKIWNVARTAQQMQAVSDDATTATTTSRPCADVCEEQDDESCVAFDGENTNCHCEWAPVPFAICYESQAELFEVHKASVRKHKTSSSKLLAANRRRRTQANRRRR
jgi:hypothetical protein